MTILGLMSGTSLDGVDLAICNVSGASASIVAATTVPYPDHWHRRLASLEHSSAFEYAKANVELGHYFGHIINEFLADKSIVIDAVASHGHTIFHQPLKGDVASAGGGAVGFTTQIGDGDAIAATTGLLVVSNFRTLDVALGGQGAPLVPIGDELLFGHYDACLNLGGIANISYCVDSVRVAFDICPCNMALNRLSARLGLPYDPEGENARCGILNERLSETLDNIDYYSYSIPKSIGKEWFVSDFWPLVEAADLPTPDLLRTVTDHIARQVAHVVEHQDIKSMLVTGGGAFNSYLIGLLCEYLPKVQVIVPDSLIVNYKEALIFAFLGYLRLTAQVNTLASVTGARCDSIGGNISGILPK